MYNSIVPSFLHELCFRQRNYEENETKYQPVHEGRGLQKCMILNYSQNGRTDLITVMPGEKIGGANSSIGLAESAPWICQTLGGPVPRQSEFLVDLLKFTTQPHLLRFFIDL